jgi:hypothetical protein
MRFLCASVIGLTLLSGLVAQQAGKGKGKGKGPTTTRFGIDLDLDTFPQKTPQVALTSVLRALAEKRFDYLIAQLADPAFVQSKMKLYKSTMPKALAEESKDVLAFQRLVKATAEHFRDDPTKIRELARYVKDGEWKVEDTRASASYKLLPARKVFLKKIGERWYLEDSDKDKSEKKTSEVSKDFGSLASVRGQPAAGAAASWAKVRS